MWGIFQALKMALIEISPKRADPITVYSDAQLAIWQLQVTNKEGQVIITQITKQARQLQSNGGKVIIRWIPSHSRIEKNERADKTVKKAATNNRTQLRQWSSLTHIKQKIIEAKNSEIYSWHWDRNEIKEKNSQNYYVPCLKPGIHPILRREPKKYASRFF